MKISVAEDLGLVLSTQSGSLQQPVTPLPEDLTIFLASAGTPTQILLPQSPTDTHIHIFNKIKCLKLQCFQT